MIPYTKCSQLILYELQLRLLLFDNNYICKVKTTKDYFLIICRFYLLWILIFDFERILFTIQNYHSFKEASFLEWILCFVYSLRLDITTATFLIIIPLTAIFLIGKNKYAKKIINVLLFTEFVAVALIHSGEILVYDEWQHKLTSRVFTHLSNPDEMFRTAGFSTNIMFLLYLSAEILFSWRIWQWLIKNKTSQLNRGPIWHSMIAIPIYLVVSIILLRGGLQQIPININSAFFSNHYAINDLSTNSTYYFVDSYLMYKRGDIDRYLPDISREEADKLCSSLYDYPKSHDIYVLKNKKPNIVFIILESWSAEAIGCMNPKNRGATPNFDKIAQDGLLFTGIYSGSNTSEIGNLGIFSGLPAIPEMPISQRPEKYRKLPSLNQDLARIGYSTHYMFSGDLKYGNIGGYLVEQGFQDVIDESDFPSGLERGQLNYYDKDAYNLFLQRIRKTKSPFLHCIFTGSTHAPFDHPKSADQNWKGEEAEFMNSLIYADKCLGSFLNQCAKEAWFDNTIFVIMADHGHNSPGAVGFQLNQTYHIPILIWGNPLKSEFRGKRVDKIGNQSDIPATILYQLGLDNSKYTWSKDLLNPFCPEFAFHTVIRGYGWVSPKGGLTWQMEQKQLMVNSFSKDDLKQEQRNCDAFLVSYYNFIKDL